MLEILPYNIENQQLLTRFLTEVDDLFSPPLFDRIKGESNTDSINQYAEKLLKHSNVIVILGNDGINGMIAIYTNNLDTKIAYIPILAIKKEFSGQGYATKLVESAAQLAEINKMDSIELKTWPMNIGAISLYKKALFRIFKTDLNNVYLRKTIK